MDYFKYDPDRTMALEILRFDKVELQEKMRDNSPMIDSGTLIVLFIKDCSRFLLCLNEWKYLLLKRLPVMTFFNKETNTLCYSLPTPNGLYILKFSHITHKAAIKNFDTILKHNSDFYQQSDSLFGPSSSKRKDDEIESRNEFFSHNKRVYNNIGRVPAQALEVEKVRKRDRLKRKILHLAEKMAQKFSRDAVQNINLTETKSYDSLKNTSEKHAVPHFLLKREVDQAVQFSEDTVKSLYEEAQNTLSHTGSVYVPHRVEPDIGNKLNKQYNSYQCIPYRNEINQL